MSAFECRPTEPCRIRAVRPDHIGSDEHAAEANGIPTRRAKFLAYMIAGAFYGSAGLFVSAQSGGADPLVGASMLIQLFAAVVLGGTPLTGGRGGVVGSIVGAYLLMGFINTLFVFSLPTYLAPIFDGVVLILAVTISSMVSGESILTSAAEIGRQVRGLLSSPKRRKPKLQTPVGIGPAPVGWLARHRADVLQGVPALAAFALILALTIAYFGGVGTGYVRTLLILTTFLGVMAFGQTIVIITGGLDLSIPWAITLCATIFTSFTAGSDASMVWSVPVVLGLGALIGLLNGLGVALLCLSPIVVTLATNSILKGLTLFYTGGVPSGVAPPALRAFVGGSIAGLQPAVWAFIAFAGFTVAFLSRSSFGRRLYAVGNNVQVSYLSGIDVRFTRTAAYMISGVASALVAILVVGFNSAATLSMGEPYLLPSIAVVVAGGVLITGGRGHYVGVVFGVMMLVALQILIGGTQLPDAVRSIILGLVLIGALLALQKSGGD